MTGLEKTFVLCCLVLLFAGCFGGKQGEEIQQGPEELFNSAVVSGNAEACLSLEGIGQFGKASCVAEIAVVLGKPEKCELLEGSKRDICYEKVSIAAGDKRICDSIASEDARDLCKKDESEK